MTQQAVNTHTPPATPVEMVDGHPYTRNRQGHLVALQLVAERDKLEDQLVRGILARFETERQVLAALKGETFADIRAFRELCAEKLGVEWRETKGNLSFLTYDGNYRVQISIGNVLQFNSDLENAETLIAECLQDWTADSGVELRTLVDRAFRRNKETGEMSIAAVLELRSVKIGDPRWTRAMDIVSESLRVVATKTYVRVHKRLEGDKWQHISLNFAEI